MSGPDTARDLDLLVFGATGFTGGLTAEYLARHAPARTRWALAGRNPAKLAQVRERLAGIDPRLESMELLGADLDDAAGLADLVGRAKVVITTVGPYLELGEPLVAACAEAGTDYVDLTGEPEFVDLMYLRHHRTAEASGARIVHACGFDSVPYDLGALFTIEQLQPTGPVDMRGVVRAKAAFSGGTFHSAMGAFSRARQMQSAFKQRIAAQPPLEGRSSRAVTGRPTRDRALGLWLAPMPTIDPQIVARSGAALPAYGPRFRYSHYAGIKRLPTLAAGAVGVGALFAAAQVPPVRRRVLDRVPQGQGPDAARRERSWFTVDLFAESEGRSVHTRVSGGDPGYGETAKMLSESALCLAFDDVPDLAGQLTTAVAMGDLLIERLRAVGIRFEVIEE